jgi:hypothetical protein
MLVDEAQQGPQRAGTPPRLRRARRYFMLMTVKGLFHEKTVSR